MYYAPFFSPLISTETTQRPCLRVRQENSKKKNIKFNTVKKDFNELMRTICHPETINLLAINFNKLLSSLSLTLTLIR